MSLVPLIPLLQANTALGRFVFGFLEAEVVEILRSFSEIPSKKVAELATAVGWIEILKAYHSELKPNDLNDLLVIAASRSQIEAMKLLKELGATNFNSAFLETAREGRIEAMKLLKFWGATNFNLAIFIAARGGHIEAMKLLKNWSTTWGGAEFAFSYCSAMIKGHTEAANLLKYWNETNFEQLKKEE